MSLAATVAEGLGKMLMHNYVWVEVGLGSIEQNEVVKVCIDPKHAGYALANLCATVSSEQNVTTLSDMGCLLRRSSPGSLCWCLTLRRRATLA